ncbi:MAG TPA: hypothetical protein VFZ53_31150 [Polyangiaceae bacterium]
MPRLSAALLACIAWLCAASAASGAERRVVVLQPDEELFRAVALSLSAWGIDTTESDAAPPEPSQPEAVQAASRLARELGVEAVIWISTADRGSLLWVFDARAGDVTTRLLAETPPFDSAGAAAVALSVKTVLRSSVLAPPAERFGAQPPAPAPSEPPRADRSFALELGAGGYLVAERQAALRLELAALGWMLASRRLGVSLEFSTGPSLELDDTGFRGRYREIVAGASVRYRVVRERTLSAAVSLGGAAHFTSLEATLEGELERSAHRVNPSLDAEASVSGHWASAYLGAALGLAYFPTYRRYLVEGEPVFSPWPIAAGLRGYVGVDLF